MLIWIFKCLFSSNKSIDDNRLIDDVCCFCLSSFTKEKCIELKCGHIYHKKCFDTYVKVNKKYKKQTHCPYCDIIIDHNYV